METVSPALEMWSLNRWPSRDVPKFCFLIKVQVTSVSSICENSLSSAFMIYALIWMCYTSIKNSEPEGG